ncbi:MAG: nucleotidyl transferase AbiEii/AbiGii toxin family protein [Pseudomonadota bacterium]
MFYLDLFRELEAKKVRYLLVGGLAVNLHGVPRTTMDVDLIVALDHKNLEALIATAQELKLKPVAPVNLRDLADPVKRQEWASQKHMVVFALHATVNQGPTLDILIEPGLDIEAALGRAVWRDVQGIQVPLASVSDLIQLKEQSGRAQDLADIEHLRRIEGKPL